MTTKACLIAIAAIAVSAGFGAVMPSHAQNGAVFIGPVGPNPEMNTYGVLQPDPAFGPPALASDASWIGTRTGDGEKDTFGHRIRSNPAR